MTVLILDYGISKETSKQALCKKHCLTPFDFMPQFLELLRSEDELAKEANLYLNEGELVPTFVLEKFLLKHLVNVDTDTTLLVDYPRTVEQFRGVEKVSKSLKTSIKSIWFVKQTSPSQYLEAHLDNLDHQYKIAKSKADIIERFHINFINRRRNIDSIKAASLEKKWNIIEIDYFENASLEAFTRKIDTCA